jgi:hypothetical protein
VVERDIEASTTIQIPIDRASEILVDDPLRILADPATADDATGDGVHGVPNGDHQADHLTSTLTVWLAAGGSVSKDIEVEVGRLTTGDGVTTVPLHWRASGRDRLFPSGRDRLFPSFDGALEVRAEAVGSSLLTVRGTYTVPLGPVGRFGDGVIGRRLARQSLSAFVEGLARRLDGEANPQAAELSWHPAPYAVTVRESAGGRPRRLTAGSASLAAFDHARDLDRPGGRRPAS